MDLYYTYVSGTTYKVNLVVYGDCSGSAFYTLGSSAPVIDVYNGGTYYNSVTLALQAPTGGTEVTPVCPAQARNTTCTNPSNPIPGIKKYLYSANVTLSSRSAVWRFLFNGSMGGSSTAGRSTSITNIYLGSSGSPIALVDTLNNLSAPNTNALYTSIPTPFFCINTTSNFNPGAVDPDGDYLNFNLVPAVDAATGSSVSYVFPFSPTAPLAVSSGSFSFSSTTGQISFYPNVVQRSLVVYNVREFREGALIGTSQREMTVVILSPCTNTPPTAAMSAATAGSLASGTLLNICNSVDTFQLNLNPTDADGDTINMSVSGLPAGATFTITGNNTTAPSGVFSWNAAGVTPGSYVFYVTLKDNGCPIYSTQTIAYIINVLPTPGVALNVLSLPTCAVPGRFQVTPLGTGPWMVDILSGSSSVHLFTSVATAFTDSLPAGTYTVRVYNSSYCTVDTLLVLPRPAPPNGIISTTTPICIGDANGTISVSGAGGLSPYAYALGSGTYSASGTFTGLVAGIYSIHIRDANSCVRDTLITVLPPAPLRARLSISSPSCAGFADGSITISGYNTSGPYSYAIGGGTFTATGTFGSLPAGRDTLHVRDGNGCLLDTIIILRDSVTLRAGITATNIACSGDSTTLVMTGRSGFGAPYQYAVAAGTFSTSGTFTLPAGTHNLHLIDSAGCRFDTNIVIRQPAALSLAVTALRPVTCHGANDGTFTLSASGGTRGYRYSADGGYTFGSARVFAALGPGSYAVAVTDTNNCLDTAIAVVTEPARLFMDSLHFTGPHCYGDTNGTIRLSAAGGTPGYTYALNSGSYSVVGSFTRLLSGSDTVHIRDVNGCALDSIVILEQPSRIVPAVSTIASLCTTFGNGAINVRATGGIPGYQYALGSGSYNDSGRFHPLSAATYRIHCRDSIGCIADTSVIMHDSLHIFGLFTIVRPTCFNDSNATVTVTGAGGDSAYSYAGASGVFQDTGTFSHLRAGTFSLSIRDSNGCIADTSVFISQPNGVVLSATVVPPSCAGDSNGTIQALIYGGTPGYQFRLNSGAFRATSLFTGLLAGSDTLYATDTMGCLADTAIVLTAPLPLSLVNLSGSRVTCNGGGDATVIVYVTGGTPRYRYWANTSSPQLSPILTGLPAGRQYIHIIDSNGCHVDTALTIDEPARLTIANAIIHHPTCEGFRDGDVTLTATGGTYPYHYSTDNTHFNDSGAFHGIAEGYSTFFVRDSSGCTFDTTLLLTGYPHINITALTTRKPTCKGTADGSITLSLSGGIPALHATLSAPGRAANEMFDHLTPGTYTVTITDSMGCIKDSTISISDPDTLVLTASITPNDCLGVDDGGGAMVQVTGGIAPYRYLWINDSSSTPYISGRPNGTYMVEVTDSNNCKDSMLVTIRYDDCCVPVIPNAFTPNGDGRNDVFRIRYKGDIRVIEFAVYNRFGERVFLTEYTEDGWNGIYNGKEADIGVYYYHIRLLCGNLHNAIQDFTGDVTLIR